MQDLFENFVFDVKIRLWLILRRLVPWFIIIVSLCIIIINIIYDSFDVYIFLPSLLLLNPPKIYLKLLQRETFNKTSEIGSNTALGKGRAGKKLLKDS